MPIPSNQEKVYARIDKDGRIIPSTLVRRKKVPKTGRWVEVGDANACCPSTSTTTTIG